MKNEFVPYDIAKAMKELGFDEPCVMQYTLTVSPNLIHCVNGYGHPEFRTNTESEKNSGGDCISAPLYQQAFRWFREKYKLHSIFEHDSDNYYYVIQGVNDFDFTTIDSSEENGLYLTYEEAQDACLRKLLEIVKKETR